MTLAGQQVEISDTQSLSLGLSELSYVVWHLWTAGTYGAQDAKNKEECVTCLAWPRSLIARRSRDLWQDLAHQHAVRG